MPITPATSPAPSLPLSALEQRDEFIAAIMAETPAPPDTQPVMEVESIDISGDAASVKVTDEFAGMRFTDYLSLLKIENRWIIVNKLYHLHAA